MTTFKRYEGQQNSRKSYEVKNHRLQRWKSISAKQETVINVLKNGCKLWWTKFGRKYAETKYRWIGPILHCQKVKKSIKRLAIIVRWNLARFLEYKARKGFVPVVQVLICTQNAPFNANQCGSWVQCVWINTGSHYSTRLLTSIVAGQIGFVGELNK